MNRFRLAARIVMGFIFTVFGLNGFFNFLPPPELSREGYEFIGTLVASGYVMKLVKLIEVAAGIMLLANKFVGLALILLAPIVINIFCFHFFIDTKGLPMAVILVLFNLFLGFAYREKFQSLFTKG